MSARNGARIALIAAAMALLAGCGIDIDINGPPKVVPGQSATFQVTTTNVAACPLYDLGPPLGIDFEFAPFVPRAQIVDTEFAEVCGIAGPSRFTDTQPGLAHVSAAEIGDARSAFESIAAQSAASVECSGTGITCFTGDGTALCDTGGTQLPNETRSLSCQTTAPNGIGPLYSIAVSAQFAAGVCKLGSTSPGVACVSDSDCGGAVGSCGTGICSGGNTGNGCEGDGDCLGGTCTDCVDDMALGVACFASDDGAAPAPTLAPWGIALGLAALGSVAFWRLRGRRV